MQYPVSLQQAVQQLIAALRHLGQLQDEVVEFSTPVELLQYAVGHWDLAAIPAHNAGFENQAAGEDSL